MLPFPPSALPALSWKQHGAFLYPGRISILFFHYLPFGFLCCSSNCCKFFRSHVEHLAIVKPHAASQVTQGLEGGSPRCTYTCSKFPDYLFRNIPLKGGGSCRRSRDNIILGEPVLRTIGHLWFCVWHHFLSLLQTPIRVWLGFSANSWMNAHSLVTRH